MFNYKIFMRCCFENPISEEEKQANLFKNSRLNYNQSRLSKETFSMPEQEININSSGFWKSESLNQQFSESKFIKDQINLSISKPNQEFDPSEHPVLKLKIIESSVVQVGTEIRINSLGLEGSKRAKNDHKTYIGSQLTENGEIINDYVIEEQSFGMGKQHFIIKFNLLTSKYTISDIGDGTGTFIKIRAETILKDNLIICYSNSFMKIVSIGSTASLNQNIIIKFLHGPKANEEYCFQPSDKIILIGRMTDCKIKFEDTNMSRYQCCIVFDKEKGWILNDGNGKKGSLNGTWLFVENEFEIIDKLVIKAGKTLFESHFE
ncbi:hypothetical protein SteCoe_36547 [Stentor coeruleus]|uniref:FHA domain-containing protein n=1 Tax=Stentor coeruleus TaxID=5963 RepID=A0A1R2AQ86_9CILI|nr:hypothetical protein SteCoe_36547 [Stentor coeruleus]